jgi:hypothetical protein
MAHTADERFTLSPSVASWTGSACRNARASLLSTHRSTKPAESMIEIVRHHARRFKGWQHGELAPR